MFIGVRELDEFSSDLRRTNAAPTPGNFYKSCRYRGSKLLTKSQFSTRESELLITNEHGENIPSEMVWNIGKHLYFPAETRPGIFIGVREPVRMLLEFSYIEYYNASSQVFQTFWPTSVNPTSGKCYLTL